MGTAVAEFAATDSSTTTATPLALDSETDANDPSTPSAAYRRMEPRWRKCRACMAGTEAIRAGGTTYLPRYEGENETRYNVRRVIAAFYNGFANTVLASVGMLLEEEPTLSDDMPQELAELWENIDAAGTHGAVFARRLVTAGLVDSHAGILVEHSRPDATTINRSKASAAAAVPGAKLDPTDEKALGLRPYMLLFRADDVLEALDESVNGVRTLVQLRLRERVKQRVGLFGRKTVTQYRVYTNTDSVITYELWRAPTTGGRPVRVEGPTIITNQTEIPWSPFLAGDEVVGDDAEPGELKPALIDLADLNIQYHTSLSNHLSLQSLAYVPTPVRIGAPRNEDGNYPLLVFGPGNTIEAPEPPAGVSIPEPVYWLSPPVDVLEAGERTLSSTKADMGTLGAAFMSAETRAAETAEGKRIDSGAKRATLATTARALKDCLERAFGFLGNYRKLKAGSVAVNDDFTGEGIDPTLRSVIVTAFQADIITLPEARYILQTGQFPEDFDAEAKAIIDELMGQAAARAEQLKLEAAAKNPQPDPATEIPAAA